MRKKAVSLLMAVLVCLCMNACGKQETKESGTEEKTAASEETSAAEKKDQPITVQAGDVIYYADEVQRNLDILIEDYALIGNELTEEQRAAAAQEIVDEYAARALMKMRLRELKLDEPDDNTLYAMREAAQKSYDEYWQQFRDADVSAEYTDAELTRYLEENGIDLDYFYEMAQTQYETQQLVEYYHIKADVTEEEIDAFYQENYVKPSRERYENNIPLFEEEVIEGEADSAYIPEGFRILHQIVIPVPEEIQEKLVKVKNEAEESAKEAEEAYNKIADLTIQGKDTEAEVEKYRAAMSRIDALDVEYGELWQSVLDATADACDEIYARMQTGETFDDLMKLYDPENVLIYHEKSQRWSEELMAGAATLKEKGDISQPTLCVDGVHILCYYDDIPSGETELSNAEDRAKLRSALEQQRLSDAIKKLTDDWKEEYDLVTDLSTLTY